ncbi:MAG: (Fe-S)-binding protein [Myxococcota bacterium]
MSIALFVPCYVDQLKPRVGLAALDLLRAAGFDVEVLDGLPCCGQPLLTAGEERLARDVATRFVEGTRAFDSVVTPSGSCASTLEIHGRRLVPDPPGGRARVVELTRFLSENGALPGPPTEFPRRVGLHASCHALRELRQGTPSETREQARTDPAAALLTEIPGLELIDLTRRDECCGFGGVFAVEEEAVSTRMGLDRLSDHRRGRAEVLTSTDVSCLLHLEGLARREGPPLEVLHVAEILAETHLGAGWLETNAIRGADGSR